MQPKNSNRLLIGLALQCDANIIEEIAAAETVTTLMLVEASKEVVKSMDRNWYVSCSKISGLGCLSSALSFVCTTNVGWSTLCLFY